ncbi:MAG TPA: hypothetical protein PK395_00445 [bacterium]|nr:hypothetical protein [bacterium]HQP98421.1 hypothetical protein [bacterium]
MPRLCVFFLTLLFLGNSIMAQIPVKLSISEKGTGHPLRLPVRLTTSDGQVLIPENAEIAEIYLEKDGIPRPDASIYVDGALEFDAPEGPLSCEVAGAFRYHFFKRTYPISKGRAEISIELTPWEIGERLRRKDLPTGDVALWTYSSGLDGCLQAFQIAIPEKYDPAVPIPLRFHLHGHGGGKNVAPYADRLDSAPRDPDMIRVSPICRGDTHYQGMGEYEFFEIYNGLQKALNIDLDRVMVEGYSMGGAGTWHLAGRFPYLFSAAFPHSGYLDYRVFLWTARGMDEEGRLYRDGGYGRIFRQVSGDRLDYWRKIRGLVIEDWQVPLYERQGTMDVLENTLNLPMLFSHGIYDMSIFGGVDIENSYRAWKRFQELGYPQKYFVELPKAGLGHGGRYTAMEGSAPFKEEQDLPPDMAAIQNNLRNARRDPWPRHVVLRTNTLEYNKNAWGELDALDRHWRDTLIDVELLDKGDLQIKTRNVKQFTLNLSPELVGNRCEIPVVVNRVFSETYAIPDNRLLTLRFDGKSWVQPEQRFPENPTKRHDLQGPILHAFHRPHLYVYSTDQAKETAENAAKTLRVTNGGWLCSLMPCSQQYHPLIRRESEVKPWEMENHHLIIFGLPDSSPLLSSRVERLPISYDPKSVQFGVRTVGGEHLEMLMIYPDPVQPDRYLVWCTPGVGKDVFAQLWHLPDFVVWENGKIVFTGFFDEEWQPRND